MEEVNKPETKDGIWQILLKFSLFILIFSLGAGSGIFLTRQTPEWFGLTKGVLAAHAEADSVITKVGKLMTLPAGETPTVATVTDASKVKDQPFFINAKNGDMVLIYSKAQKAILFRPSENKIIDVGAVNINNQAVQNPTPTPTANP